MVTAKERYYYTFKVLPPKDGQEIVECAKWDSYDDTQPVETYRVKPGIDWMGCTCPAYRKCKHQKCVEQAFADGKVAEFWKWKWTEKHGWQRINDIQSIEELEE